jgi:hypothetical protein
MKGHRLKVEIAQLSLNNLGLGNQGVLFIIAGDFLYFLLTTVSLRRRISARKFPSPQAGSRKRLSMRSVSWLTKSSMALTSCSAVNTSL